MMVVRVMGVCCVDQVRDEGGEVGGIGCQAAPRLLEDFAKMARDGVGGKYCTEKFDVSLRYEFLEDSKRISYFFYLRRN